MSFAERALHKLGNYGIFDSSNQRANSRFVRTVGGSSRQSSGRPAKSAAGPHAKKHAKIARFG